MPSGRERSRASDRGQGPLANGDPAPITYCLVPADLAGELHDPLRRHFRDQPGIEVVVERRGRERRGGTERRTGEAAAPEAGERRRIRAIGGRRIADRRAPVVAAAQPPALPRRARRHAERIVFVERLEPSTQEAEDRDTAQLVARFQAGDRDAFAAIYARYFDRVYGYLRTALRDTHEAEDTTQQVFLKVFEALPRYERRGPPFRAWLFVIVRNHGIKHLRKHSRLDVVAPEEIDRRRDAAAEETDPQILDWITDRDLLLFVERLPLPQRQVLVLRYMMGLSSPEMGEILGRNPEDVRILQHRAIAFLRSRLSAIRQPAGDRCERTRMHRWSKQAPVLRSRRFILR